MDDAIKFLMQKTGYHKLRTIRELCKITGKSFHECTQIVNPYYEEYGRIQAESHNVSLNGKEAVDFDDEFEQLETESADISKTDLEESLSYIPCVLGSLYSASDSIDDTYIGIKGKTDGLQTTRETVKRDLFHFLLYIASTADRINNGAVALLNMISGANLRAEQFETLCEIIDTPVPSEMVSLSLFMKCDRFVGLTQASDSPGYTSLLVQSYQTIGDSLNILGKNTYGVNKVDRFVQDMEYYISSNS